MRKTTVNLVVDTIAYFIFACLFATGLILEYSIPPGEGNGAGKKVIWDLTRHQWGDIHFILALVLIILIFIHMIIHWRWIYTMTNKNEKQPNTFNRTMIYTVFGISVILILIPFFLPAPQYHTVSPITIQQPSTVSEPIAQEEINNNAELIRGNMTIQEVSAQTGLSIQQIQTILGINVSLQKDEKLGRLLRREGISMQEARKRLNSTKTKALLK